MRPITAALLLAFALPTTAQDGALAVTINVVDAKSGRPVQGVALRLLELHPTAREGVVKEASSGPGGQVDFSGLFPGAHRLLVLSAPKKFAVEQFPVLNLEGSRLIEMKLFPAARVSGKIVLAGGLAGPAAVQVQQIQEGGFVDRFGEVGANGAFEFEQLNALRPIVVTARAPGAHGRLMVIEPKGKAGKDFDDEDGFEKNRKLSFTLVPYDASVTSIAGLVTRLGLPVPGLGVAISSVEPIDGAFYNHACVTGADGRYSVPRLPAGIFQVFVLDPSGPIDPNQLPLKIVTLAAGGFVSADIALAVP